MHGVYTNRPRRHKLNCKNLPLVDSSKHLGVKVGNMSNGLAHNLMAKRALYDNKVNELTQESVNENKDQ